MEGYIRSAELVRGKLSDQANTKYVAARIQMTSLLKTILTLSLDVGGILGYSAKGR